MINETRTVTFREVAVGQLFTFEGREYRKISQTEQLQGDKVAFLGIARRVIEGRMPGPAIGFFASKRVRVAR